MKYTIQHKTSYAYLDPVSLCHNIARLVQRSTVEQTCTNTHIRITPKPDCINEYEDFFGNKVVYFSIEKEHWELTVDVTSEVERLDSGAMKSTGHWSAGPEEVKKELSVLNESAMEIKQYSFETMMTTANEDIISYGLESFPQGRSLFEGTEDLTRRNYHDFDYKPGHTTIATPLA